MTMLEIQKYLSRGGTLDALSESFAIEAKRHTEHPNLVLLKYNQIASPFGEQIVRECRGIVLDEADGWRVVSRAFDKFFNLGEGHAAPIDWASATVFEKLDGSLCTLYWYAGKWHVATTGTPDASGDLNGHGRTFASLFWQAFNPLGVDLEWLPRDLCFYFELTSPLNRVVVPHTEIRLTLLGARHRDLGMELPLDDAANQFLSDTPIPRVRAFQISTVDDLVASFANMNPLAQEGYVVCDRNFNRIKVKHPGYVALHRAKDGFSGSIRAFVEIARTGESPEVVAVFPEFKAKLDDVNQRLGALVENTERDFAAHRSIASQKEFALQVRSLRWSSALFRMRSHGMNAREFYAQMPIKSLVELLGYNDEIAEAAQ